MNYIAEGTLRQLILSLSDGNVDVEVVASEAMQIVVLTPLTCTTLWHGTLRKGFLRQAPPTARGELDKCRAMAA